jgi:predicted O-methyltransferase YrrM
MCRFVYVPRSVIRKALDGKEDFHAALTVNTGLRRACGRFLMISAADTLIPLYSLEALLKLLGGELHMPIDVDHTYFLLSRSHVPWQFVKRQPDMDEWDRYLLLSTSQLKKSSRALMSVSSGAGALMMHRSLWHKLCGLDEKLTAWGWNDLELGLRISQHHPWVELSSLGVSLFHMEHSPYGSRDTRNVNVFIHSPIFQTNDENWGLGNYELEVQLPRNVKIPDVLTESIATQTERKSYKTESWNQSSRSIVAELADKKILSHVKRIFRLFLNLRNDWKWKIDLGDLDSLFFLSWYGQYHYPRRYLEFGVGRGYAAAVVASASPGVEIYGIDRWEGVLDHHAPFNIAFRLKEHIGRRGYIRFINGDITTGLERLHDSFIGSFYFDLILVRGDLLGKKLDEQIIELLNSLASGGALVLTCGSAERFKVTWQDVQKRFPQFLYFHSKDRKTGMVLAGSLQDKQGDSISDETCFFRTGFLKWVDISPNVRLMRWLCNMLKRPSRYPEYVARMCRQVKRSIFSKR